MVCLVAHKKRPLLSRHREIEPPPRMALSLQPPPPPLAPLSYSPPSELEIRDLNISVLNSVETAFDNIVLYLQDLEEKPNDSLRFQFLLRISNLLHLEEYRPIWQVLYPSSLLDNTVMKEVRSIRADLADLPNKIAQRGPIPLPLPVDVASVAALDKKMDDLRRETTSSLKSFAEVVKASVAAPAPSPPQPPKAKTSPPALKGNLLPQAVIRYRGCVDPAHRSSFVDLVTKTNSSLRDHPKHSHVRVVGVKWTSSSNLVVRTQAPSPHALVAALRAVIGVLSDDHRVVADVIPNTRWSRMTLSHVYTGKEPHSTVFNPEGIHEELTLNNPNYALLVMRQLPNWLRNPSSFTDGQISSVSFAFEDQDGSIARRLVGTTLTMFGNLRCSLKAWVPKKTSKED